MWRADVVPGFKAVMREPRLVTNGMMFYSLKRTFPDAMAAPATESLTAPNDQQQKPSEGLRKWTRMMS